MARDRNMTKSQFLPVGAIRCGLTGAVRLEQIWVNKGGFYGTIKN
jgi:hypothetical protein